MDEIFFVRFTLQQSLGIFGENQFSCDDIIGENKEEIERYITECREWQEEKAFDIASRYSNIGKLEGKKVLYVGDSLTADRLGYRGITTIAAKLDAKSSAVSGATSVDMVRSIYGETLRFRPEIVSVLIGANDSLFVGAEEKVNLVGKDEYRRNLTEILTISKNSGAFVMVMTFPDVGDCSDEFKANNNENVAEYNDIIRDVAKKTGVVLVDLNCEQKKRGALKMLHPDGVHLNKDGQAMLADLWIKTLTENI